MAVLERILRWLRAALPRLYFTRFPLLFGAVTVGIVPVALKGIPTMLASMFVLTPFGIAVVTLFATAAAFTVLATRRIVLVNGAARFGGDWRNVDSAMRTRDVAVHALVAAPIVVAAVWRSVDTAVSDGAGRCSARSRERVSAVGLILGVWLLNAWLAESTQPLPDLVIPRSDLTRRLHGRKTGQSFVGKLVNRIVGVLRPLLGPGYVDEQGRPLRHTCSRWRCSQCS